MSRLWRAFTAWLLADDQAAPDDLMAVAHAVGVVPAAGRIPRART